MKKLCTVMVLSFAVLSACAQLLPGQGVANDHALGTKPQDVQFVARGGGNAYGYRACETAVGLTILPWSLPNFESTVKGVRINLGWGAYDGDYGFDTGVFSASNEFAGIAVNLFGNYVAGDADGTQIGLANVVGHAYGLQIGLVNYADHMVGVQIGLLNFARSQWSIPLVNFCW